MAKRPPSRLQKRREIEAAESQSESDVKDSKAAKASTSKKKTAAPKKAKVSRKKVKVAERKRLYWGVFSGSLKEEARFPYDQKAQAEERLEQLLAKGKKLYFIQPIKESLNAIPGQSTPSAPMPMEDEEPPKRVERNLDGDGEAELPEAEADIDEMDEDEAEDEDEDEDSDE